MRGAPMSSPERRTLAAVPPREINESHIFGKLAIVIPAFNEEQAIETTLLQLRSEVPDAEIVVVDDGSTDATAERARGVPEVTVLSSERNRGYGASLRIGMRACTRPYVAWYDADGQHRPADLKAVVQRAVDERLDMVIGTRGRDSDRVKDRVVGKFMLNAAARLISGEHIPDLNSGLRCFRRDVIVRYLHLLPDGFSASSTSTLMLMKRHYRVGYVPIVTNSRIGKSTVRVVRDGFRTLQVVLRIVVLFQAFKVFTTLGLALLVPGLLYGLAIAFIRGEGFPTLAGTAVIAGLLTFYMAILADQVVELRKERFEDQDRRVTNLTDRDARPPR
jgi:glycosyltransferase involved in cell wall biosynthesis